MEQKNTSYWAYKSYKTYIVLSLLLACTGCEIRKAMYDQPKSKNLRESTFFQDGKSARTPPEGTVARGHLNDDLHFYTGKTNGQFVDTFPYPVTAEVLARGQERFNIFCANCHDRAGTGWGMIVQRGYKRPPSYHIDRLRQQNPGYFFDVITKGFGQMPSHNDLVPPEDRWAIVAYTRALQLSQTATLQDVPEEKRAELKAEP